MNSSIRLLPFIIFLPMQSAMADDPSLSIQNIPDSLIENSYAVIRRDEMVFEVKDLNRATLSRKRSVTLLNNKYKDMSSIAVFYSPEMMLKKVDGRKYDSNGKVIDEIRQKDIEDYSVYSDSFFDDNRVKKFELGNADYPYTYEFEFTQDFSSLIAYPSWRPLSKSHLSIENASFKVILPKNLAFRFKEYNLPETVQITEEPDRMIYSWNLHDLKAIEKEKYMPDLDRYTPCVITAPNRFEYENYPGDLSTWKSYGNWVNNLNEGRDQLSDEKQELIHQMVDTVPDRLGKIRRLYEYLQKNTRYISIQLGIGGYQPFEAGFVDEFGYGDCKALTNYMKSLLSVAGIKSYYTLVQAGRFIPDIQTDFPSAQFNHVILCVPDESDTVWLECTSQDMPFGYLGTFTDNRSVLIITEEGGVLGRTPQYTQNDNLQVRKATVQLDPSGNALAKTHTKYSGLQYENISSILETNRDDQKKWLYDHIDIPYFEIQQFDFLISNNPVPEADEYLALNLRRYATVTGKRLFVQPNLMNKQSKLVKTAKKRIYELELVFPYIDIDTLVYEIPPGYHLEFIPGPVEFETKFGNYYSQVIQKEDKILYVRRRMACKGIFPPDDYDSYVEFMNRIAEADNFKIVLVNKT
jgi:hypothetical protein